MFKAHVSAEHLVGTEAENWLRFTWQRSRILQRVWVQKNVPVVVSWRAHMAVLVVVSQLAHLFV